jgi:predicted dehydrogenase/threonine dehydrogenase-like Zn-dependent dehydrogenase
VKQVCLVRGEIRVLDVPPPACRAAGVLVRTSRSLISTGTELALTGGGGGSLLRRAVARPDLVRRAWEKVGAVGLRRTIDLIRAREQGVVPLGYSAAGEVVEVGADVRRLKVGDRVACGGAGYANHAELNYVPENLAAVVPAGLVDSAAAFGTVVAIALHAVRRLAPTLGEQVVVVGLGLLGQLTVQLLRLSGCRVLGVDPVPGRILLARGAGLEDGVQPDRVDPGEAVAEWTAGVGADAVVVCAAAREATVLNRALDLCRRKGRLVLLGDVPIRLHRERLYRKEVDFLISTSSGPGRYDPRYEEEGHDYPFPYVRWTEGRNLGEALRLMAAGQLRVDGLDARTWAVDDAPRAYTALQAADRPIAALLDYGVPASPQAEPASLPGVPRRPVALPKSGQLVLGIIGAGAFVRAVHLPNLRRHGRFFVKRVIARSGVGVHDLATRAGIPFASTDARHVLEDPEISAVLIATRHDTHAPLVLAAVRAGKHVLVEKPLGLTTTECEEVVRTVAGAAVVVAVGFNRRFAPLAQAAQAALADVRGPRMVLYRVNAGPLAPDHWLRDPREGGGRLLGEGVHFLDFARWLVGADPRTVHAVAVERGGNGGPDPDDVTVSVSFADGSLATVVYASQGHPGLPKERLEVFAGGRALLLDDFRRLDVRGPRSWHDGRGAGDKGHAALLDHFHHAVSGTAELAVTATDGFWATWCAEEALRSLRRPETGPAVTPR